MKILGICASPRGSKSTTLRLVQADPGWGEGIRG